MDKIQLLNRKEIFKGKRVNLVIDELKMPNGKIVEWELVTHNGAAAIIPIDEEGNIILVRQYRNAADDYVLEIPAGGLEPGEDPKVCASRELEEETGYKANQVDFVIKFYSSIGITNEIISIYVGKELVKTQQNLDEDEYVTIEKYDFDTCIHMINNGLIVDNKTITALLAYQNKFL
ncbi:NUDIX hydrolase [Vallitalea pronyensis]|uniref:NUDIX hydrolase n=1 Tax=Vallitalea pronyensis TaxID=1348613 RepID=A0A8J8SGY4_9FIRM|nr:NUDIX hydrolase [Vallitalea pronyensis]QUI23051.1 NUDIX hydrolase [Vallitalea pronyensis]